MMKSDTLRRLGDFKTARITNTFPKLPQKLARAHMTERITTDSCSNSGFTEFPALISFETFVLVPLQLAAQAMTVACNEQVKF